MSLKVASNVFDLSSGQYHASIRDQIVRAQLLVRDLCAADPDFTNLMIVGAGIGGLAAATAAAGLGKRAVIVESQSQCLLLQRNVKTRYIGPFIYEWPHSFCNEQSYPPKASFSWAASPADTPTWTSAAPLVANQWAAQVDAWFKNRLIQPNAPEFHTSVDRSVARDFVRNFVKRGPLVCLQQMLGRNQRPSLTFHWGACSIRPDYVILAAGMGEESTDLLGVNVQSPRFWEDDTLMNRETPDKEVAIFGGGDGALQDVLRALTPFKHPLEFIDFLTSHTGVKKALRGHLSHLLALETQNRLLTSWTQGSLPQQGIDSSCRRIAQDMALNAAVRSRVFDAIRDGKGRLSHVVRESHFSKAYLLNRFLVHLINESLLRTSKPPKKMGYRLLSATDVTSVTHTMRQIPDIHIRNLRGRTTTLTPDVVAVRFGITPTTVPAHQMIQLSQHESGQRTTLAHIPLPYIGN